MKHVVDKAVWAGGEDRVLVCERGSVYGWNNLVVDMRSLAIMRETGCPVVFDATHSVQLPGGNNGASGGSGNSFQHWRVQLLDAVLLDCLSKRILTQIPRRVTGPNSWPLQTLAMLLEDLMEIDFVVKNRIKIY